ncbi:protein SYS1 homolog [Clavelina lepadiformis]|uniref:Protein SYS1 homolog n=1 Tax=Clavelina lepadiformis TaxID=159417 RepID=A0ABP0H1Y0_CLALP
MAHLGVAQRFWNTVNGIVTRAFPSVIQYQKLSTNTPSANLSGRFRSFVWDPALILAQMITMQCLHYATLGLLSALCLALGSYSPSLHYIFDSGAIHYYGQANRLVLIAHITNSAFGALALWYVVQKAKQCLDFTCTLHLFHFLICCIYSRHFPTQLAWWLVQIVCIVLMVVIGEYLCFKSDMKDIPLVGAKADV